MSKEVPAEDLQRVLEFIEDRVSSEAVSSPLLEEGIRMKAGGIPKDLLEEIIKAAKALLIPIGPILGKFLVVTGIDRSGKETQCFNPFGVEGVVPIYDALTDWSYEVLRISLPSYETSLGSLVGAYLKRRTDVVIKGEISKSHAWILWSLDRAQHHDAIAGWLRKGRRRIILSKRWTESNVAYQKPQGVNEKRILSLERHITKQDYTIILDLPPKVALQRVEGARDVYENITLLEEVRQIFAELPKYYPFGKTFIVNGARPPQEVNNQTLNLLKELF